MNICTPRLLMNQCDHVLSGGGSPGYCFVFRD